MTTHVEALERLAKWRRTPLVHGPTPLIRLNRLATALDAGPIYAKMDAETGFALGGNKVRKLEFELAPDRIRDVTHLITAGGPQSNHCRVTAAFAARHGLECALVVNAPAPETPTGNALLHRLFGAELVIVPEREDRVPSMELVARRIAAEGGHPLVVPIGASTGIGALGYVAATIELAAQIETLDDGCDRTLVVVSASSCGTIAGLQVGFSLMGRDDIRLLGVSADATTSELSETTRLLATEAVDLLGGADPHRCAVEFDDRQVGAGYGLATPASLAATDVFGRLEGIVLDPTYTSKAAAGMIERIRLGIPPAQRVVFVHTGGAPGLLA